MIDTTRTRERARLLQRDGRSDAHIAAMFTAGAVLREDGTYRWTPDDVASLMADADAGSASGSPRRRRATILAALLTLLACATAITLLAVSRAHWMNETERFEAAAEHNLEAAERWEDTADEFERKLGASESDVKSLRVSQRRVAAQKAKVEDQRAALEDQRAQLTVVASSLASIADGFSFCASTLDSVIDFVLSDDYATAGSLYDTATSQCSTARSQLDALDLAVG